MFGKKFIEIKDMLLYYRHAQWSLRPRWTLVRTCMCCSRAPWWTMPRLSRPACDSCFCTQTFVCGTWIWSSTSTKHLCRSGTSWVSCGQASGRGRTRATSYAISRCGSLVASTWTSMSLLPSKLVFPRQFVYYFIVVLKSKDFVSRPTWLYCMRISNKDHGANKYLLSWAVSRMAFVHITSSLKKIEFINKNHLWLNVKNAHRVNKFVFFIWTIITHLS